MQSIDEVSDGVTAALENVENGAYINSKTAKEFEKLKQRLESEGFKGAGNVHQVNASKIRELYIKLGYSVIGTQGFNSNGQPLQGNEQPRKDYVYFFIRLKG